MADPAKITDNAVARCELEQKLIGWMLYGAVDAAVVEEECQSVVPAFDPLHQRIFNAIVTARRNGTDAGAAAIVLAMADDKGLREVGGLEYLRGLASAAPALISEEDGRRHFSATLRTYKTAIAREDIAARAEDAIQALNTGATDALRRLSALGAEARDLDQRSKLTPPLAISVGDFLMRQIPPRRRLLPPWLFSSGLAMVHAWRGVGKTHFAIGAAIACATGGTFLRWRAETPSRVLYVDGEMNAGDMQTRIRAAIGSGDMPSDDMFRIITPDLLPPGASVPNLQTPEGQDAIEPDLVGRDLIIIDNVATLFRTAEDQNAAGSWVMAQDYILTLRRRGIAVLLVDHDNKSGGNRGTSAKHDVLDTVIQLKQPTDYVSSQGARFEVHFTKHRGFRGADAAVFEAQLTEDRGQAFWTTRDAEQVEIARVREMLDAGLKERDIREELGIGGSKMARLRAAAQTGAGK